MAQDFSRSLGITNKVSKILILIIITGYHHRFIENSEKNKTFLTVPSAKATSNTLN